MYKMKRINFAVNHRDRDKYFISQFEIRKIKHLIDRKHSQFSFASIVYHINTSFVNFYKLFPSFNVAVFLHSMTEVAIFSCLYLAMM